MRIWGVAVVCALGCTRELALPNFTPLAVSPSTATVAPRETLQLTPAGGVPPYAFALQQKQSGERSAVTAAGAYVAGDDGPAADVVRVTDSTGGKFDVAIAVGPSLSLSPASALVAPGGRVVFTATGGKRPYAFSIVDGPGAVGVAGDYVAGSQGDTVAHVRVRDATADASAAVEVHVGPAVSILPRTASIAPYSTLDFVAIGGQPPYRYAVQTADGATVDAETGHYQAGAGSGASAVQDTVTVTDALSQAAAATIQTGPPLGAAAPTEVHPFTPVRIAPTGGLPPYSFAFAAKGDATRGTIDAVTGVYTPGSNYGMNDVVEVRDATPGGRAVATVTMPPLGSLELSGLAIPRSCLAADLDGDGRQDAVTIGTGDNGPRIDVELMAAGGPPVVMHDNLSAAVIAAAVADLNGDRHDDLVILDSNGVHALIANGDGSLSPPMLLASSAGSLRKPLVTLTTAHASGPDQSIFYYDKFADPASCNAATAGLLRMDWPAKMAAPNAPVCVAATASITNLALGDFNHDGQVDLAWTDSFATLHVYFGPDYFNGAKATLTLPSGYAFSGAGRTNTSLMAGDFDGDGIDDLVALSFRLSDGRNGLVFIKGDASGTVALGPWTDPVPSATTPIGGIVRYVPSAGLTRALLAWSGDGHLYRIGPDFSVLSPSPPQQQFTISCAATPDTNGDGAPDLLVAGGVALGRVLPGDGDGNFGRRSRVLLGLNVPLTQDVDADGADDLVYRSSASTMSVLFGGAHRFSLGPTLQLPFATFAFSIAPVFGAAASDLVFSPPTEPAPLVARARGDGSWDPPVPLTSATAFPAGFGNSPLTPAKLGGAAPGRDLITIDVNGNLAYPFIRDDATHPLQVTLLAPVAPPSNCFLLSPLREMPDVDGDGFGDLIATCAGPTLQVARSDGKGAALSFGAWETVATSPNGDDFSMVSDRRLLSGRVPFVLSNFSVSPTLQVGTFLWTGSGWASSFTDTHLSWDTTIMGLDVVSLSPGTQSVVLFTVAGAYAFSEQAGGSLGAQRKLGASGQAYLVLAPGAGAPPDILGIPNPFASTLEGALFVNAGDGTFP